MMQSLTKSKFLGYTSCNIQIFGYYTLPLNTGAGAPTQNWKEK